MERPIPAPGAERPSQRGAASERPGALVVPIRSLEHGKARLASTLDLDERRALARFMFARVLAAAGRLTIVVVTNDGEARALARDSAAQVLDDPGSLDEAAASGLRWARESGFTRAVVAHADLPHAADLDTLAADGADAVAIVVPDLRGDGTPVISLPTATDFGFAYGPRSFGRHVAEARRAGLRVVVRQDATLGFDVDTPEDLAALRDWRTATAERSR